MTLKDDMKVYYETFPDSLKCCDWCNKTFRTVAGLRTHALRMHPAETVPNKRPKCRRCGDTGWLGGDPVAGISDEPCGCYVKRYVQKHPEINEALQPSERDGE